MFTSTTSDDQPQPSPVDLNVMRAAHLTSIGRAEEARALLLADPETAANTEALVELSRSLDWLERYDEALEAAEGAVRVGPDEPAGWLMMTLALIKLDRPVDALAAARRSLALAPEHFGSHHLAARTLGDLGRFDEAYEHAAKTMELAPDSPTGWTTLCRVQLAHHRWSEAAESARRALAIEPDSDEAKVLLGIAQGSSGTLDGESQAMETLIDSLRSNPDQHHVRALLVELVKPRRFPIPMFISVPVALLGGVGLILVAWAAWVGFRWYRTPTDVKTLVLADPANRWRIGFGILAAVVVIVGMFAITIVAFSQIAVSPAAGAG